MESTSKVEWGRTLDAKVVLLEIFWSKRVAIPSNFLPLCQCNGIRGSKLGMSAVEEVCEV